ncbi:MAG: hypothetical protein EAY75_13810, partial [Bacteroidetes bacterium]
MVLSVSSFAIIRYVRAGGAGNGSGSSWSNASGNLQTMINASGNGDEVWVAGGTYRPTADGNRDMSFAMKAGVKIYGSFAGNETSLAQRILFIRTTFPSILSGDLGNNDLVQGSALGSPGLSFANNGDNSYHVISNNSNGLTTANSLLDGFIISGGNATGTGINQQSGGGMLNLNSSPALANIIFRWNNANAGGGLFNFSSAANIENAIFFQNTAANGAGIVLDQNSTVNLFNNIFSDNRVSANGGAMYIAQSSSINIFNTTFTRNYSPATGAVLVNSGSSATVKNSIVWGNLNGNTNAALGSFIGNVETVASITYSIVEGGWTGTGNTAQNPAFINAANPAGADGVFMTADDGLRPEFCTPAYNTGNNSGVSATDIMGNNRLFGIVDLGPYELQEPIIAATNWYLDADKDGYYVGTPIFTCASPGRSYSKSIIASGDCNDNNAAINPGSPELCNGVDDNCNNQYDEGTSLTSTIIANGNIAQCSVTPTTLAASWGNKGIQLNGANQYLITPNLKAALPDRSFTIELWFKANSDGVIVADLGQAAINTGWHVSQLELLPNNRLMARVWELGAIDLGFVSFGTWNHAVIRYDDATITFDGVLNGTISSFSGNKIIGIRQTPPSQQYWAFGAEESTNLGSGRFFSGELDEIRIWNRAITLHEVMEVSRRSIPTNTAGLVAYYGLDNINTTSMLALDATPNAFHASLVNNPTQVAVQASGLNFPSYFWNFNNSLTSAILPVSQAGLNNVLTIISPNCRATSVNVRVGLDSVLFVDASKPAGGNGNTWRSAFNSLQDALEATNNLSCIKQIWVAKGTYKPTNGTDRTASFRMKNGIAIYGGFAGTETALSQRDLTVSANTSILSGDLNNDDEITGSGNTLRITKNTENSYRVIDNRFTSGSPLTSSAILDGFVIKGGSNEIINGGNFNIGGGMLNVYASPTLRNLTFFANYAFLGGGGMANQLNSSPVLENVIFDRNIAQRSGGGLYNYNTGINLNGLTFTGNLSFGDDGGGALYDHGGTAQITNCVFENNTSSYGGAISFNNSTYTIRTTVFSKNRSFQNGGGIFAYYSNLRFFSSLLTGQNAGSEGGAIHRTQGSLEISNCTITNNASRTSSIPGPTFYALSGVLRDDGTPAAISNSIIWGNANLFYGGAPGIIRSIVQGGYSGTLIFDQDPQFRNINNPAGNDATWFTADDGLQLTSCSPGINGGENLGVTGTDLLGNTRIFGSVVDFGAYEFQGVPQPFIPTAPVTTNNALSFNGTTDRVELVNTCGSGTPIVNGGDAITIEYWFRGSVLQSAVRLQQDGNNYIVSGHFGEHIMSNNGGAAPGSGVPVGAAATDGRWHHIAMTWQRNRVNGFRSYLDGQLVGQRDAGNAVLPTINTGAYLGALFGNAQFMNGALEDVKIWNVARTQAQIQAGICDVPTTIEPGLVAWYAFDHGVPNGNNAGIVEGIVNKAQPGYYNGRLSSFAWNGTTSNFVNGPGKNLSRIYVNKNNTSGVYDGQTWATAFQELTDIFSYSCMATNVEVWVAAGTYKPTLGNDRNASFKLRNGMAIYGGFAGNETALNQRNFTANETILSGNLNGTNSWHVFYINDFLSTEKLNSTAILDGFTVTGGSATFPDNPNGFGAEMGAGGGFYLVDASPLLRNLVIKQNGATRGGGMYNGLNASPQLIHVELSENGAANDGPAMYNFTGANVVLNDVTIKNNRCFNSSIGGAITNFQNNFTLTNCHFSGNYSKVGGAIGSLNAQGTIHRSSFINNESPFWGGAVRSSNSSLQISNSLFAGNSAVFKGGVFYHNNNSSVNVSNSTFFNNRVGRDGEFINGANYNSGVLLTEDGAVSTFTNSIIWGNLSTFAGTQPTVTHSVVQGGYTGTGNISVYPRFVEPTSVLGPDGIAGTNDDGLRLKPCSPALNVGNNTNVKAQDILGNNRIFNSTVDMGAYELQEPPSGTLITLYRDADGDGFGNPLDTLLDCGTLIGWVTNNGDCNDAQAAVTTGPITNPATFGTNVWNVHVWSVGGGDLTPGTAWTNGYAGFYVDNNLNIKTTQIWSLNSTPSTAPGYIGCTINTLSFSYSAKRTGFPEGEYRISIPSLYEAGELWINGSRVWSGTFGSNFSGPIHGTVWTGFLNQSSQIEFRVTTSGSFNFNFAELNFTRNITKYVKTIATGTGDGSSWANATSDLQNAINTSNDFSQVWVAAGTYNLSTSLTMKNGVGIYGGFAGTEDLISQRNLAANTSILTTNGTDRVILNNENGVGSAGVLDGFTIQGGNAARGGGIANWGASPTIRNCIFRNNTGGTRGAATSDERNSAPTYINCVFTNNSSNGGIFWSFGDIVSRGSSPTFVNCTVSGNSGGNFLLWGGRGNATFRNCIVWNNTSSNPWIGFTQSEGTLSITHSIVEGGFGGTGNLNQNPLFVSATNFRLQDCSPAIDAGSDANNTWPFELDGAPRRVDLRAGGTQIDMGAYELQTEPLGPVSVSSTTTNNALSFDGVNDHVALVNVCGTGAPIINGGDEITIEYWFKGSVLQSAVRLQPDGNNYIVSGHFGEHILSNDGGFSTGAGVPVGAAATDGNWHHVAMTWKRNTVNGFKSYLDGQLVGQRNSSN